MTYLTRIRLNPGSIKAGYDLRNPQSLHERVMDLIPESAAGGLHPRTDAQVLFRLESDTAGHTVLVQSRLPLNLDALPVGYAQATDERDLERLLEWLAPGRLVRYRIDAQPIAREGGDARARRRGRMRHLHGTPPAGDWWARQAQKAGLKLEGDFAFRALPERRAYKKYPDGSKKSFKHILTRFEGVARVDDEGVLREALRTGIGRSKGYGGGLLTLAPLH